MKKIFTLCIALFSAVAMFAQDAKGIFEFTDKDGNVVPSGSVLTRTETEVCPQADLQISTGLFVKQTKTEVDGAKVGVKLRLNITELPHGDIQYCFPQNCFITSEKGVVTTNGAVIDASYNNDLKTEWIMGLDDDDNSKEGKAVAKLTLIACKQVAAGNDPITGQPQYDYEDIGESSTVTVHFVYNEKSTGINGISNADATVVARYAADGTRLSAPQKGLNIVKLSNGKTVKYIK